MKVKRLHPTLLGEAFKHVLILLTMNLEFVNTVFSCHCD